MNELAVVIPIYKININVFEQKSLIRCISILNNYCFFLIHPNGLDLRNYDQYFSRYKRKFTKISFDSDYFKDINAYSLLMTSPKLYDAFNVYEYILVYQLDAYIFKNDIKPFIRKKYDYIGAPVVSTVSERLVKQHITDFSKDLRNIVFFNGGFSLRRVSTFLEITKKYDETIEKYIKLSWAEDIIFSILLLREKYCLPEYGEALSFSFDGFPRLSFVENNKMLPTGCHAWYRDDYGIYDSMFWLKFIMPVYYYRNKISNTRLKISKRFSFLIRRILWSRL